MVKRPREGDLVELDAVEDTKGHEQQGRRPGLVVSVEAFHDFGLAIVCPITTHGGRATRSSLEVAIPKGLPVTGYILPHQVRTVDFEARKSVTLGAVPRPTLLAVRARLKAIIGL